MKIVESSIKSGIDHGECGKMAELTWEGGQHRITGFELRFGPGTSQLLHAIVFPAKVGMSSLSL